MPLELYPDKQGTAAFTCLSPVRQFQMSVAFVGHPKFHFGDIGFTQIGDLKDRLILAGMKARVAPSTYRTIVGRDFASVTFTKESDFKAMMSVIHEAVPQTGRLLNVQVTDKSSAWHDEARAFVNDLNMRIRNNSKGPEIVIVDTSDRRKDYVFPTMQTMKAFCAYIETKLPQELKSSDHAAVTQNLAR